VVLLAVVAILALTGVGFAAGRNSAGSTPAAAGQLNPGAQVTHMTPWMQAHVGDIAWMQQHMGDVAWMRGHWNRLQWMQAHPGYTLWMQTHPAQWTWMRGHTGQHPVDADPPDAVVMDDEPHGRHRLHARPLGSVDRVAVGHDGVRRIVWVGRRLYGFEPRWDYQGKRVVGILVSPGQGADVVVQATPRCRSSTLSVLSRPSLVPHLSRLAA